MSLEIEFQVGEDAYFITSSDKSYEISEYRNIKAPGTDVAVPTLCPFKWFGSLEGVVKGALNMQVRASDARSFAELKEVVQQCTADLISAFEVKSPRVRIPTNASVDTILKVAATVTERRRRTNV